MKQQSKLGYIDSLRGYAIFLVIFAHSGQNYPQAYPSFLRSLINLGPRGVQLFFIVSALTLFLSTEKRFLIDKKPITSFFIRRFFRIAPLFYGGMIFYSIFRNRVVSFDGVVGYLLFLNSLIPNVSHANLVPGGWSISSEMLFYLFVPILIVKIKNLNQAFVFTFTSLAMIAILKGVVNHFNFGVGLAIWNSFTPYIFPFSIPVFGIGICFYFVIFKNDTNLKSVYQLLLVLVFIVILIYELNFLYTYFFVVSFGVIAFILSKNYYPIIENPIVKYFGKISYSMYIVHFAVIELIEQSGILISIPLVNSTGLLIYFFSRLLLVLLFTIVIATFLYNTIEVYGQKIGKTIIKNLNRE